MYFINSWSFKFYDNLFVFILNRGSFYELGIQGIEFGFIFESVL